MKQKNKKLPKVKSNLPNESKGNIQELLANNSELEKKRIKSLSRASKDNLFAFKNGKKINWKTRTLYCNYCDAKDKCPEYQQTTDKNIKILCAFDPIFDKPFQHLKSGIRNEDMMLNAYEKMIKALLYRLARGIIFEQLDGGLQDKNVTENFKTIIKLFKRLGY